VRDKEPNADAEYDGVRPDQPQHGQCPRSGLRHQKNSEDHRSESRDDQHPLAVDLLPQADRGHDLENARADCPNRDVEQEGERGDTRREERQDAYADAEQPLEE